MKKQAFFFVALALTLPACKDSFSIRNMGPAPSVPSDVVDPVGDHQSGGDDSGGNQAGGDQKGTGGNPVEPSVLTPYQCGTDSGAEEGPGIVGGTKLKRKSLLGKSVVFIFQGKDASSTQGDMCTATLISSDVLVTAAHCVQSGDKDTRAARTRAFFHNDPYCTATTGIQSSDVVDVEKIEIHPEYQGTEDTMKYDIALIKLKKSAPAGTQPLKVAKSFIPMNEQDAVYLAGYGVTTDYDSVDTEAPMLRYAKVKAFANPEDFRGVQNKATSPRLIFDQNSGGACRGDSGGPAIVKNKGALAIVGVASQVFSRGETINCKAYVLHTSLSFYNTWLSETYEALNSRSANPFR